MQLLRDLVDELLHAKVKAKLFGGDHAPKLGRLVIEERLGAGAMGTVFAAFDPRLERRVAVKVLRADIDGTRVLAEARALAKLAHPNVVAVYDADELDGVVYIVMEHVAGASLRTWITPPHDWHDVVRVMRDAGTGIAAAHAAGLVHRDIKPDNILIGDDRARVVDFGLAHAHVDGHGVSAGTPYYMAPEVLAGGAATAASDQFSFAVTLYEALYGKRPHGALPTGEAATERAEATTASQPSSGTRLSRQDMIEELRGAAAGAADTARPAGSTVPAWLHAVVSRALAADPLARFGSMDELVSALRPKRRSRALAIAAGGLALGALVGVVAYRHHATATSVSCDAGDARIATTWSADARAKIAAAFASTPWHEETLRAFDAKASEWKLGYRTVCQATQHGEQSGALLDLRMRCLMRAYDRFGVLVGELAAATDMPSRVAAPAAVGEIDVTSCEALTDPGELALPADATQRAEVEQQERALDRAQALFSLGRYKDARAALPADDVAAPLPRLTAQRLALAASIEARIGDPATARKLLDAALLAAAEAHAPGVELEVWSRRLRTELFAGDPAKVLEWETFARAAAKRAARSGAELDGILGEALRDAGKLADAKSLLVGALASTDPLRPEQRAVIEMNLASVQLALGDSPEAVKTLTQARDRVISAFGDHHPDVALYDDKLAAAIRARGAVRKAAELHEQSLALRTAAFGADDRAVATSLLYRAQTELEAGDLTAASTDANHAKTIRERVYGATSPRVGEVHALLGDIALEHNLPEIAVHEYRTAASLDPRLSLLARRVQSGDDVALDDIAPLAPAEVISVDRMAALAARVQLLMKAGRRDEATQLARAMNEKANAGSANAGSANVGGAGGADPSLWIAVGDAFGAAAMPDEALRAYAAANAALGDEPTRMALHAFVARAKLSKDKQTARVAVSLYQAMPQLSRSEYDALWELSK